MPIAFLLAALLAAAPVSPAAENSCRNGSFEVLEPNGFPAGWGIMGKVEVCADATDGTRAVRLTRNGEPPQDETGLNSPHVTQLKGGIGFSYKALAAKSLAFRIFAIPLGANGIENTGAARAVFTVPAEHIGDGLWHEGRLKYDFSRNAAVARVTFGPRLEGTSGGLILDAFSYLEHIGPVLRFGVVRLREDRALPGKRCTLCVPLDNAGDVAVKDVRVTVAVPPGLAVAPTDLRLGDLASEVRRRVRVTLEGERAAGGVLVFTAVAGDVKAETRLVLAPKLEIRSCGPVSPVAAAGEPIAFQCVLANTGTAAFLAPRAEFVFGGEKAAASAERVPPGTSVTLAATFTPRTQTPSLPLSVAVTGNGLAQPLAAASSLVVCAPATGTQAVISEGDARLAFPLSSFGYGPGELSVKKGDAWKTVGWLPRLGRVVYLDRDGVRRERTISPASVVSDAASKSLRFTWPDPSGDRLPFRVTIVFTPRDGNVVGVLHELSAEEPCRILAFEGPMLYALDRDEAIYPGLEWLVEDEVSSSTLDIAEGHADQVRYVVHPNFITIPAMSVHSRHGTVGLLWSPYQKWDGIRDRPSAVFASPDRFEHQRGHLMGLFLPSVPEFVPRNTREADAKKPYELAAGAMLTLAAEIYADPTADSALAAINCWTRLHGIPQPAPPPRGSYERELEFSMRAYLDTLWIPEKKEWWTTKGGGMMSTTGRPREYVADLLVGALLAPDAGVRTQCRARADEVLALIGGAPCLDAQRVPGRFDLALADPSAAASLLASRDKRGAWEFDADQEGAGPFVGADYHDLGPHDAVEVGTLAAKATTVLRYARMTGDPDAFEQMRATLELMESFRVPRAAQVWEVPVHTPDILAAAEAVEAFLEAYRCSGDVRWLKDAVTWARRGLPFVYLWEEPQRPFLLGASIPVFGATWMQGSWFGRPVQWNGLRYVDAISGLAEYDESYPWRRIAALLTHSAMQQQDASGPNAALWPDNIGAVDNVKCPWVFAPRMIIAAMLGLMDRSERVATTIVGEAPRRVHINANAKITNAAWNPPSLRFDLNYPPGEQGTATIFCVARPTAVLLNDERLAERTDLERDTAPGWRYEPALAALSVRVPNDGVNVLVIQGADWRSGPSLPHVVDKIAFEFAATTEGWLPAHALEDLSVDGGALVGTITGGDPYLVRTNLRAPADTCPIIVVRMKVGAGRNGQFYWGTDASPNTAEDKVVVFPLIADGEFHEYRFDLGTNSRWVGRTITTLRIDPGEGGASVPFAIDYVRGLSGDSH